MAPPEVKGIAEQLLARRGLACFAPAGVDSARLPESLITAAELDLAGLGYLFSTKLRVRLRQLSAAQLTSWRTWALAVLAEAAGAGVSHEPLFRHFPQGVPANTRELWWGKVLVHFLQAEGQPCLFCSQTGTTHVLNPCRHVVCSHCFDGSNYSACPVCEHHVDRSSPFFRASPEPPSSPPKEQVRFRLLHLGADLETETRAAVVALCERKQALSPADREMLAAAVKQVGTGVLEWLPATIPVRENIALIFGTLMSHTTDDLAVLAKARPYLTTATDVLRLLAVRSGADGSLLPETRYKTVELPDPRHPLWGRLLKMLRPSAPSQQGFRPVRVPEKVYRFRMAKLRRPVRRALLELLDGFAEPALTEDLLRHRSYWVWAGEFLHPGEYAARYPRVARAFEILRGRGPDGMAAPRFVTWNGRLESALRSGDASGAVALLRARPGEMARRVDVLLRSAPAGPDLARAHEAILDALPRFATPVLLTLRAHLGTRHVTAPFRAYWPKGRVALNAFTPDRRPALAPAATGPVVAAIEAELLRRFAAKPRFECALLDTELRHVPVPFNERSSSSAGAVALPRGARISLEAKPLARLFLHWCEPAGGEATDLDLSVALYDASWQYVGVCSYYELVAKRPEVGEVAKSSGDFRNAPPPLGATEFVDLSSGPARRGGVRYAVMVINAYSGLPFDGLERAFAGLMLRDDPFGDHFDPRTVQWKFALAGSNGVFLPLVFDLDEQWVHWLDVQAPGELLFNNVATSSRAITSICPRLIEYFASGARPTMWELGLLHAAARCRRVLVRTGGRLADGLTREERESPGDFLQRLLARSWLANGADTISMPPGPLLALLERGDLDLPAGSSVYALFRERLSPNLAAADLLS